MASKIDKKRRKELLEQYKQIKTYIGIIQIKNNVNGKIFIDTCSNLKNRWFTLKWNLDMGRHPNSKLQKTGMNWVRMPLLMKFWRKRKRTKWMTSAGNLRR